MDCAVGSLPVVRRVWGWCRRARGFNAEAIDATSPADVRQAALRRLHPLPWTLPLPLRVHGRYSRAEVLAAFDAVDERGAPRSHREGVLWHQPTATDLLFVTLKKSEALFSPTTRYRDLALGPSLFHWESQSTTTAASATGQRYLHHEAPGSRVLLFVRGQRR